MFVQLFLNHLTVHRVLYGKVKFYKKNLSQHFFYKHSNVEKTTYLLRLVTRLRCFGSRFFFLSLFTLIFILIRKIMHDILYLQLNCLKNLTRKISLPMVRTMEKSKRITYGKKNVKNSLFLLFFL